MDDPKASLAVLPPRHEAYLVEARRLQALYAPQIHLLVAFEAEYIRPDFGPHVRRLVADGVPDFFIGSVHHVHGIPIDYDRAAYDRAAAASSSSPSASEEGLRGEDALHADYYDLQLLMLRDLEPRVVGHFDLVRLLSDDPARDPRACRPVWDRIVRNLRVVRDAGAWLECNSAALRKGLAEPYPGRAIAEVSSLHPSFLVSPLRLPPPFCSCQMLTCGRRNGSGWEAGSPCRTTATASTRSRRTTPAPWPSSRASACRRSGRLGGRGPRWTR